MSFKYDVELSGIIRQINGIRYSDTYKCWYTDDNEETLKQILQVFREKADVDISALGFRPGKYLFEGQSGDRYSAESVYRVFKEALHRAGIKKDVGVHSLRHSYATHLHESGLDIRYIQELLGHRSTRTTEIYTHVSRRNLVQVRSPIEDMDVK